MSWESHLDDLSAVGDIPSSAFEVRRGWQAAGRRVTAGGRRQARGLHEEARGRAVMVWRRSETGSIQFRPCPLEPARPLLSALTCS